MGISEEQLQQMKERVAGKVKQPEPVRATLPAQFTIIGHAVGVNNSKAQFVRDGKIRTIKTEDAREWSNLMESQLREQWGPRAPWDLELYVIADVYLAANRMDYDAPIKSINDALQAAGIIVNDRLIRRGTFTKHVDKHRPRVELVLYPSTLKPL